MQNNSQALVGTSPKRSKTAFWRFLIPSIIGLFLFMIPVHHGSDMTIPVAVMAAWLRELMKPFLIQTVAGIVMGMAVLSVAYRCYQPAIVKRCPFLHGLLAPTAIWLLVRIIGGIAAYCSLFHTGSQIIWEENTGGLVLTDLLPTLFSVFIFAGLLLPLLLNFGLLELFGTLLSNIMRPIFNLPGRSAIDCIASWLGDGSVGILLTSKQYEDKFYTQREAAVVGTTFSAVSITFSLVVLAQVNLDQYFLPFYGSVCLAGIVAAVILPRIPPLSLKKDCFIDGTALSEEHTVIPQGYNSFSWGLKLATDKAALMDSATDILKEGCKNAIEMVFGVLPIVMGLGTLALVLAEHTHVFAWLGKPYIPLLELLHIPEAAHASETMVVGFADMFIPSIMASTIHSDMTRFIIAAMSVTQLIYMSEVGALLLGSRIPVNIFELFVLFVLRTLITVPVITGVAYCIF